MYSTESRRKVQSLFVPQKMLIERFVIFELKNKIKIRVEN